MKVKLLPKVSSYYFNGIDYKPGSTFEIKPCMYRGDFMEALEVSEAEAAVVGIEPTPTPVTTQKVSIKTTRKRRTSTKKTEPLVTSVKKVILEPPAETEPIEEEEKPSEPESEAGSVDEES